MDGAGDGRRRRASLMLMAASGFAGLGYQIVWTQQCALWLGHEAAAVLAVVAAFFGGLAVGGFALGGRAARSARPARWYAGCEFAIALWGALLLIAMRPFSAGALRLTGVEPSPVWQWSVAFTGTFLALLPATAAMGATLPAIERVVRDGSNGGSNAGSIAPLYAANTFGAVAGVLASAFWLVPGLGLARTASVCIALNLLCGAAALALFRPAVAANAAADASAVPAPPAPLRADARGLQVRLALTGLLGIGYEVLVVRVLGQVTEETVYTFATLLAVYLVGSAAGAAGYRRWRAARRDQAAQAAQAAEAALTDHLLNALAVACLAGTASLWAAEWTRAAVQRALGGGVGASLAAEAALAVAAFALPTVVMGALFSNLADRARASGLGFGRALGVNTLGAAAAPALLGVVAVRLCGSKAALLLIGGGYLALTTRPTWLRPKVWAPGAAAAALALLAPPLAFVDVPEGGRVVSYREGTMAAVSVVEDAGGVARLRIDNRQQEGSSATYRFDARQAWLPLLLHPAPARALFLGLGTGVTAGAAARDQAMQVDAVELLPEVVEASASFRPDTGGALPHIVVADARRFVRASDRTYDVIVSDNFHPARSGSGSLYTVEHFRAVRARLAAGGLFCQWLPLHQLDLDSLRSIVRSFLAAFPQGWATLASNSLETPVVGLIGRADAGRFDAAAIRDRLARAAPAAGVAALGFEDELAVLGGFVAGPEALGRFAAGVPLNTDDHPVVAYRAPAITYAPDSSPRDRLFALLGEVAIDPAQLLATPSSDAADPADAAGPAWPHRLVAYWQARDRFITSGRDVRPSPRVQEMLAQVREPLLAVLRISPDFRPAYDPLLSMASALARSDRSGARTLLTELSRIQPARDEATRALDLIPARSIPEVGEYPPIPGKQSRDGR